MKIVCSVHLHDYFIPISYSIFNMSMFRLLKSPICESMAYFNLTFFNLTLVKSWIFITPALKLLHVMEICNTTYGYLYIHHKISLQHSYFGFFYYQFSQEQFRCDWWQSNEHAVLPTIITNSADTQPNHKWCRFLSCDVVRPIIVFSDRPSYSQNYKNCRTK